MSDRIDRGDLRHCCAVDQAVGNGYRLGFSELTSPLPPPIIELMNIYEEIVQLQREGRRGAVATIVSSRGSIPSFQSAKMLVRDDGSIAGTIGGGCVEAEV